MERYIWADNKKLRCGLTTGSCATAAAKAAALQLLGQKVEKEIKISLPSGEVVSLPVCPIIVKDVGCFGAEVIKDGGDDPDNTDGARINATIQYTKKVGEVDIDGGIGVGRVTKAGLDQPVGRAAINRVPRQMIGEAVKEVLEEPLHHQGVKVVINVPDGEEIAKKTFNGRLGILGGISILGTTGIVKPMSESSLIATIEAELKIHRNQGEVLVGITPGNYGERYAAEHYEIPVGQCITCSNFVGKTLDLGLSQGYQGMLYIGNIGKLIKVAGGIMNTHSKEADSRLELLAAYTLRCNGTQGVAQQVLRANTTEEALDYLNQADLMEQVGSLVVEKIKYYMEKRVRDQMNVEVVMFSNTYGLLGKTKGAQEYLCQIKEYALELE